MALDIARAHVSAGSCRWRCAVGALAGARRPALGRGGRAGGAAVAWGNPSYGGTGVPADVSSPADGARVVEIASNFHAFAALLATGGVRAWGDAGSGGSGLPADVETPLPGARVVSIAAAAEAFAAILENGAVRAWGMSTSGGELTATSLLSPAAGALVVGIASSASLRRPI